MSEENTEEVVMTVPGIKYGIRSGLIPNARTVITMMLYLELWTKGLVNIKLPEDITDEDYCQRGPDGRPLTKVTPTSKFQTMQEYKDFKPTES